MLSGWEEVDEVKNPVFDEKSPMYRKTGKNLSQGIIIAARCYLPYIDGDRARLGPSTSGAGFVVAGSSPWESADI